MKYTLLSFWLLSLVVMTRVNCGTDPIAPNRGNSSGQENAAKPDNDTDEPGDESGAATDELGDIQPIGACDKRLVSNRCNEYSGSGYTVETITEYCDGVVVERCPREDCFGRCVKPEGWVQFAIYYYSTFGYEEMLSEACRENGDTWE